MKGFELMSVGWNLIVKYSAGNSDYNNVTSLADFYSTDSYTASFPDDLCGVDPAEKCDRPHKHILQKELLAHDDVTQVFVKLFGLMEDKDSPRFVVKLKCPVI